MLTLQCSLPGVSVVDNMKMSIMVFSEKLGNSINLLN